MTVHFVSFVFSQGQKRALGMFQVNVAKQMACFMSGHSSTAISKVSI